MFVDRSAELAWLNRTLQHPPVATPGQLALLYGRRRVGKSALLRHWAEQSGVPFTYWVAEKEPAAVQRRKLIELLFGFQPAALSSWSEVWQSIARQAPRERRILILDELPYAASADPALLSSLQHAWDQQFQQQPIMIVLCGSHVHTMGQLLEAQSPLFGRMTGQWRLQPLPFGALRALLPTYTPDEQVAVSAMVGGVPTYLSWFQPQRSLAENVRDGMLAPGSLALGEIDFLLSDELRDPRSYLAVLAAIGKGHHTFKAIKDASLLGDVHLPAYLTTLQQMRYVERRLPVTIPPARQRIARQGRYHLADPFMRFYFRFIHPYLDVVQYDPSRLIAPLQAGLRAFVGQTAWEELARQWVWRKSVARALPLVAEQVGSHWSRHVQVDVVAISWAERAILLGECKWGVERVSLDVVRELIEQKAPLVLRDLPDQGQGWRVSYALFARAGVTPAAQHMLSAHGGLMIDLATLYADLAEDTHTPERDPDLAL